MVACTDEERRGLQLCVANTLLGSVLGICSKFTANGGVPFFQLVLVRSLTLVLGTIPGLIAARINPFAHHERQGLLVLRGVFGFLSITAWYWSLSLLPMSDVSALNFLAPTCVALAAPHFLRERTPRSIFYAMPFSVLGVLFVAQPSWLFGAKSQANTLGFAVGTAQALFSAGSKLTVRALAANKQPMEDILFSFGFISLLGSAGMCASMPHAWMWPARASTWAYIAAACLLGYIVQHIFTVSLQKAKAAPAAALDLLSLVWGVLADFLLFRRPPSPLSLVGAGIICAASLAPMLCSKGSGSGETVEAAGAAAGTLLGGADSPLKLSSSAEPEVQLAKIQRYLGKEARYKRAVLAAGAGGGSSEGEEAVGLVGGERHQQQEQDRGEGGMAAQRCGSKSLAAAEAAGDWAIPAARAAAPAGIPQEGPVLQRRASGGGAAAAGPVLEPLQVVLRAPNRTSSEREGILRRAGK